MWDFLWGFIIHFSVSWLLWIISCSLTLIETFKNAWRCFHAGKAPKGIAASEEDVKCLILLASHLHKNKQTTPRSEYAGVQLNSEPKAIRRAYTGGLMHVCTLGEAQMLCCDAESCSGLGLHGITQWGLFTCPRSHSWIIKLWHVKALEKEYAGSSLCFSFGWLMVASCCICIISVTSLCSFGISSYLLFVPVGEEPSDLPQHSDSASVSLFSIPTVFTPLQHS